MDDTELRARKFEEDLGKMTQEAHERRIKIIKDTFDTLIQEAKDRGDTVEVHRLSELMGVELKNSLDLWNIYLETKNGPSRL